MLSWHSCDDDGQSTPRSLFVDDVCDLFASGPARATARAARSARSTLGGACAPRASAVPQPASAADAPLRDERVLARAARARPWSASSLERWIACPVAWFVERLLRPDEFEPDPEPLARGALAHARAEATRSRGCAQRPAARG